MEQSLRVAAVQFDSKWESVDENLARAEALIASTDADLVVLPEMFATGFSMAPERIAQTIDGSIVERMGAVARKTGKAVVFSAAIQEGEKYYNRMFFLAPDGHSEYYNKRHVFRMAGEHEHYASGNERVVVSYKGFKILLLVCYDLRFPVWSRNRGDCDAIIYVASWPAVRSYAWSSLLVARAIENQAYLIGANRVGEDPKERYSGDSVVLDFLGKPIAAAPPYKEQAVVGELSLEALNEFRRNFPASLDADRFELIK